MLGLADDINGLSGLTQGDNGTLWSVPERHDLLIEIPLDKRPPRVLPIDGLPAALELESIAWLGNGRFAFGTEGDCAGNAHRIAVVDVDFSAGRGRFERFIDIPLAPWESTCDPRRGLEGLCRADTTLIAAVEAPETDKDGKRYAPLAQVDLKSGDITPFRLGLTSDTGKIAALDCWRSGNAIDILAIERHFLVSHLIHVQIPLAAPEDQVPQITPTVVFDLFPYTAQGKRNFEGVSRIGPQRIAMIVDNQFGAVTGPNELLLLTLPAD